MCRFERFHDALAFVDAARPLLFEDEAVQGLSLGLALGLAQRPAGPAIPPTMFLGIGLGAAGAPRLIASRSIPRVMAITEGQQAASDGILDAVVTALVAYDPTVPRVSGPTELVERFLSRWKAATGSRPSLFMGLRVHRLDKVDHPAPISGRMRLATETERDTVRHWMHRFEIDAGNTDAQPPPRDDLPPLDQGRLYLWDDGKQFACLYTDVANPTSNKIYARIGYRPVAEQVSYNLLGGKFRT